MKFTLTIALLTALASSVKVSEGDDEPRWYDTDEYTAPDNCCRIFVNLDMTGDPHRDFCKQEGQDPIVQHLADYGWENEMNSWVCGRDVALEACNYPNDPSALKVGYAAGADRRDQYCSGFRNYYKLDGDHQWEPEGVDQITLDDYVEFV